MVDVAMSPEAFAAGKRRMAEFGVVLEGDQGVVSKSGVKASYRYADGRLRVEILEKPFFVSKEYCEEQMRKYLGAAG